MPRRFGAHTWALLKSYRKGPRPLHPGVLPKVGASGLGHGIPCGLVVESSQPQWLWVGSQLHLGTVLFHGLGNCSSVSVYASPVPPITGQNPFSVIFWGLKKPRPIQPVRPMAWEDLRWVVPG